MLLMEQVKPEIVALRETIINVSQTQNHVVEEETFETFHLFYTIVHININ